MVAVAVVVAVGVVVAVVVVVAVAVAVAVGVMVAVGVVVVVMVTVAVGVMVAVGVVVVAHPVAETRRDGFKEIHHDKRRDGQRAGGWTVKNKKQPTPGEIAVCEVFGWDIDTLRDVEGYDHARNAAATLDEHIAKLEKDLRQSGDRQMKWWMFITIPLSVLFWAVAGVGAYITVAALRVAFVLWGRKYTGKETISFSIKDGAE